MQEHLDAARAAAHDGRVDEAIDLYDQALTRGGYYDAEIVDEALPASGSSCRTTCGRC
jgi:pentatricopeptide repeat protein